MPTKYFLQGLSREEESFYKEKFEKVSELIRDLFLNNFFSWMIPTAHKLFNDGDMIRLIELDPLQNYPHRISIRDYGDDKEIAIAKLWLILEEQIALDNTMENMANLFSGKPKFIRNYKIQFQIPSYDKQIFTLWEKVV
jgi:hypothetical protein